MSRVWLSRVEYKLFPILKFVCSFNWVLLRRLETWHRVKWISGAKCHLLHYHFLHYPKKYHNSNFAIFNYSRYIYFLKLGILGLTYLLSFTICRKNIMPIFLLDIYHFIGIEGFFSIIQIDAFFFCCYFIVPKNSSGHG